ncbi:MAG TPA: glycosyltransferase 87 family protein, partial [Candidatus Deferrimicrobium sp.]|nr:glycosyltransferase 87 family protein [Candidatus Deferrimicrobium sp.]
VVPLVRSSRISWLLITGAAAVVLAALIGEWQWGHAQSDVLVEVQGSAAALLHGQNPYSQPYSVFLGWVPGQGWPHGQGVFGAAALCYGPMVVILSIPARLLGDVRLTVVALNLAILAAILVWTRRGTGSHQFAPTMTALWVASPFVPFMVLTEWTDSFCVAGLAWWLVLRERHRGWATVALTLGLASKPSVLLVMLPLLFWTHEARRELIWAAAATVVIVAPFAIWTGIPQFVYDTVGVFGDLPVRPDGVTFDGLAAILGHAFLPGGILFAGIVVAVAVFTLRRPRDYGSLLAAGSGLLIVVCFFGKQAFLNYYFIAAMALLFVIGSGSLRPPDVIASPLSALARGRRLDGLLRLRRSLHLRPQAAD